MRKITKRDIEKYYKIIGEVPYKKCGKWEVPHISQFWTKQDNIADIDPNGNVAGDNNCNRFVIALTNGLVELRNGDRVIVLRPKTFSL